MHATDFSCERVREQQQARSERGNASNTLPDSAAGLHGGVFPSGERCQVRSGDAVLTSSLRGL